MKMKGAQAGFRCPVASMRACLPSLVGRNCHPTKPNTLLLMA